MSRVVHGGDLEKSDLYTSLYKLDKTQINIGVANAAIEYSSDYATPTYISTVDAHLYKIQWQRAKLELEAAAAQAVLPTDITASIYNNAPYLARVRQNKYKDDMKFLMTQLLADVQHDIPLKEDNIPMYLKKDADYKVEYKKWYDKLVAADPLFSTSSANSVNVGTYMNHVTNIVNNTYKISSVIYAQARLKGLNMRRGLYVNSILDFTHPVDLTALTVNNAIFKHPPIQMYYTNYNATPNTVIELPKHSNFPQLRKRPDNNQESPIMAGLAAFELGLRCIGGPPVTSDVLNSKRRAWLVSHNIPETGPNANNYADAFCEILNSRMYNYVEIKIVRAILHGLALDPNFRIFGLNTIDLDHGFNYAAKLSPDISNKFIYNILKTNIPTYESMQYIHTMIKMTKEDDVLDIIQSKIEYHENRKKPEDMLTAVLFNILKDALKLYAVFILRQNLELPGAAIDETNIRFWLFYLRMQSFYNGHIKSINSLIFRVTRVKKLFSIVTIPSTNAGKDDLTIQDMLSDHINKNTTITPAMLTICWNNLRKTLKASISKPIDGAKSFFNNIINSLEICKKCFRVKWDSTVMVSTVPTKDIERSNNTLDKFSSELRALSAMNIDCNQQITDIDAVSQCSLH